MSLAKARWLCGLLPWDRVAASTAFARMVTSPAAEASSPSKPVQPLAQTLLAKYTPWETTRSLARKPGYQRRMRFLLQTLEEEQVQASLRARPIPDFSSGDVLEVQMLVPENQRKLYVYRGVCIARYNCSFRSSFKLYNVYPDGGPVVQHIPLYMPDLVSIKVVGRVQAGSRMKKYHITEDESNKYCFQRQVKSIAAAGELVEKAAPGKPAKKKSKAS